MTVLPGGKEWVESPINTTNDLQYLLEYWIPFTYEHNGKLLIEDFVKLSIFSFVVIKFQFICGNNSFKYNFIVFVLFIWYIRLFAYVTNVAVRIEFSVTANNTKYNWFPVLSIFDLKIYMENIRLIKKLLKEILLYRVNQARISDNRCSYWNRLF